MARIWILCAACSGFLAVALGAFGAHALASQFSAAELSWWQTAVQYQFWHTLALLALATGYAQRSPCPLLDAAAGALVLGILLFSGSLYLLALTGFKALAWLTPIGGCSWLIAWSLLGVYGWRTTAQAVDR